MTISFLQTNGIFFITFNVSRELFRYLEEHLLSMDCKPIKNTICLSARGFLKKGIFIKR